MSLSSSKPLLLRLSLLLFLSILAISQNEPAQWTITPFNPPAYPLAVRSPYLNTWFSQSNGPVALNTEIPNLWTETRPSLAWYVSVVVDGQDYRLMGSTFQVNVTEAIQTAVEFTPTRTSTLFTAGPMQINASFLNPIEPTDLVRQSLPFSYLYMTATSTDGNAHSLRMYSDITGELLAGDLTQLVQWMPADSEQYIVLSMRLQTQQGFTEINNHAQDATEYYSFKKIAGTTTSWAIANFTVNRLTTSKPLSNSADPPPRAVQDNYPVLGIMVDWGNITETPEPAVWTIGIVRNPSIQYRLSNGTFQTRSPYFLSTLSDIESATKFVLDDFPNALASAKAFDSQLQSMGATFSSDYADLLTLSVGQVLGSLDITIAHGSDGAWNFSDIKVFMKNMGSLGSDGAESPSLQSVNTVDVLYAAFPAFLHLNPELGGYLLAPLLEYQDSIAYTQTYAARNIGTAYPNATADHITDEHDFQVEETANMLIMTLAYSQASGNGTFISKHYNLLRNWAEFLVNTTLTPTNQKSADFALTSDLSNNNQTNTALKGIIGIAAMAKMAEVAGESDDQTRFNNTATSYIQQWMSSAVSADNSHVDFFYGDTNSNGLMYNLYADKLLQLGLVPESVYQVLTVYYNNIAGQIRYGLPLNNQETSVATAQSLMFAASTVTNPTTQSFMVTQIHNYVSANLNSTLFTAAYNPNTGFGIDSSVAGLNSPAVGSMFALLALNATVKSISVPSRSSAPGSVMTNSDSSSHAGAIAGGTVAAAVVVAVIGLGVFLWMRRHHNGQQRQYDIHKPISAARKNGISTAIQPFLHSSTSRNSGNPSGNPYPIRDTDSQMRPIHISRSSRLHDGSVLMNDIADTGSILASTSNRESAYSSAHQNDDNRPCVSHVAVVGTSATSFVIAPDRYAGSDAVARSPGKSPVIQHKIVANNLINEELHSEIDDLRREVERLRQEREREDSDVAPPSYRALE